MNERQRERERGEGEKNKKEQRQADKNHKTHIKCETRIVIEFTSAPEEVPSAFPYLWNKALSIFVSTQAYFVEMQA